MHGLAMACMLRCRGSNDPRVCAWVRRALPASAVTLPPNACALTHRPMAPRDGAVVERRAALGADDPGWASCPPSAVPGQPLDVDIRFCVQRVANVDTVAESATVNIVIMFYWSDARLVDWAESGALPEKLWTPRLDWENSLVRVMFEPLHRRLPCRPWHEGRT